VVAWTFKWVGTMTSPQTLLVNTVLDSTTTLPIGLLMNWHPEGKK
jgi:hypothetical protein